MSLCDMERRAGDPRARPQAHAATSQRNRCHANAVLRLRFAFDFLDRVSGTIPYAGISVVGRGGETVQRSPVPEPSQRIPRTGADCRVAMAQRRDHGVE